MQPNWRLPHRVATNLYGDLISTGRKRKLRWYGQMVRLTGLAQVILQDTVQGGRRKPRPKKRWEDKIIRMDRVRVE